MKSRFNLGRNAFARGIVVTGLDIQNELRSLNEKPFQSAIETLFAF